MKTKVYSFISAKGGSGKTILTATLSDFLSQMGKKVLIIDADGSTNGLSLFYLDELLDKSKNSAQSTYGIFEDKYIPRVDNIISLENGVSLIPATYQFNNTDCFDLGTFKDSLKKTIDKFSTELEFDFILIDCQAGSDSHSEIVIDSNISDEVIIVSEYDPISAAGVERIKGFFNNDLTYDRTWVLLNKVLPEFADSNNDFLEISKYLPPILWDAEVVKRYARKEVALDFKYGNEYTLSIIQLAKTLFDKSFKKELSEWLESKNEIVKKPIYEEYKNLKLQLLKYEDEQKSILGSSKFSLIASLASVLGIIVSVVSMVGFKDNLSISITKLSPIIYAMVGTFTAMFIYSYLKYNEKRKRLSKENKYEKEILISRIQELELLKHSSIEKILRSNKSKNKENFARYFV